MRWNPDCNRPTRRGRASCCRGSGPRCWGGGRICYFGTLIHSSTYSSPDIVRHNTFICIAMQSFDNQILRSRISTAMKLKLYSTCILPFFMYGSECWAVTKRMHGKSVLSINGVCGDCLLSSGTSLFTMQKSGRGPVSQFVPQPCSPGVSLSSGTFI